MEDRRLRKTTLPAPSARSFSDVRALFKKVTTRLLATCFLQKARARLKERRHLCSVDVEPERGAWPSSARRIGGTDAASGGRHLPRA